MKYQYSNQVIPQESRQKLNDKILYLIDNELVQSSGITGEDIYNAYTGDGGLHGLKFSDFESCSEYSNAKKEIENGQFFTPASICRFIMDCLSPSKDDVIADLTCGMGGFFNFCPSESNIYGCELDVKAYKVAHFLYPSANLTCGDIRSYQPTMKMDYIVGNPPFNLRWWVSGEKILSQLYYFQKAAELLKPMGIIALVVPQSFLADDFTDGKMIKELNKSFSFLGQFSLPHDAFQHLGVTSFPTKVQFWQRNSDTEGWVSKPYKTDMTVSADLKSSTEEIRSLFLEEAQRLLQNNKSHILLEMARNSSTSSDFEYQVKKYLFQIQCHPAISSKYVRCCEYINKFYTQIQPKDMSYEEWCRVRITEAKVLAYLRKTLKGQNARHYRDEIRLVKRDYEFGYKAYSPKTTRQLKGTKNISTPIYQIVSDGDDPTDYGPYAKMLCRRQREYDIEQLPFSEMTEDAEIAEWLDGLILHDSENEEEIRLNDMQKHDINLVLQKRYALLQWEQGSGKTLAGITSGLYRMQYGSAFCTWVISPAISIKNNWNLVLQNYGIHHILIERLSDLDRIEQGDFVLVTMNKLGKYRKQIKRWIRRHNQKVTLVFDESDEMSNPSSVRAKAVLDCFRKCKFKLLMTGTSTRNNISEFAPQLELAYNNSANMISWCEQIYQYKRGKKDSEPELVAQDNAYYGIPVPAYKRGYKLFSASYLPEKITVFDVGQRTQDIFNAKELNRILEHFVITRSFEEVSGKDIKQIHQIPIKFTPNEEAVYAKAINEFHTMRENYFSSTGNSRKDAMMKLIQQITLLLRISAAPNTVMEYEGGTPAKIAKVTAMVKSRDNEVVTVGVRHKVVLEAYANAFRAAMPERKLFIVTGSTTTLAKRRALRKTLQESGNGILLCTQQSLPSSVNFEFVDKVIIPELHYNNSRMSQFYFRFIRYNSVRRKDIYFVTYSDSIESNLMQMVLAKEKLNLFMRGQDTDLDEIYERFGVDYDLLSRLMVREKDENGCFQIRWGKQEIA